MQTQRVSLVVLLLSSVLGDVQEYSDWENLHLPSQHIPFFFRNNPEIKAKCEVDKNCPYKELISRKKCWGYEADCPLDQRLSVPKCPGESRGWSKSKAEQEKHFWETADFGYMKVQRDELKTLCKPKTKEDSSLACSKFTRYCRATNIYIDFTKTKLKDGKNRFREDLFQDGDIGGHCTLNKKALAAESEHKSPLQSWYAELEHYTSLPFQPITDKKCDVVIDKPTYFIKLDAGTNLYHHFCDFVNLYASQHVNNTFNKDVHIVMWDTSSMGYSDFFTETWKIFSNYPVIPLTSYDGKKVCLKEAVFSLLARMRYGMYYNMPLIPGCYGSSFFQAFNEHLIHRLNITQQGPHKNKIRVTLLSRGSKYRNIMNEKELISALGTVGEFEVQRVEYTWKMDFLEQVQVSHNSDIFIGMHGAGLTHMLFQPNWAVVIELYNCEDKMCYYDLARLRGVKYLTWEKPSKLIQQDEGHHPTLGAHAKFTNYGFDVLEFISLVYKAADHVRSHPEFIEARNKKATNLSKDEL